MFFDVKSQVINDTQPGFLLGLILPSLADTWLRDDCSGYC